MAEGNQWLEATEERLGMIWDAGDGDESVSLSPRPKAKSRRDHASWVEGPEFADLSEASLAQYRGQGSRRPTEANASLHTGFEPTRHAMIVEGRPVVVKLLGKQNMAHGIFQFHLH